MKYVYPATLSPEENGLYSIWFDDLPCCATQGDSVADALDAAEDALAGWLYAAQKHGDEVPAPSPMESIALEPGQFVTLIRADLDAYRRFVESYSVRKNVTLPSWLHEKAEAAHVNYSQLLQDGLRQYLGL